MAGSWNPAPFPRPTEGWLGEWAFLDHHRSHHKTHQIRVLAKGLQRRGHFGRRGEPVAGILGQHPVEDCGQFLGHVGGKVADRRDRLVDVGVELVERACGTRRR